MLSLSKYSVSFRVRAGRPRSRLVLSIVLYSVTAKVYDGLLLVFAGEDGFNDAFIV